MKYYQQTRTETEFRSLACSSTDHKLAEAARGEGTGKPIQKANTR